MFSNQIIIFGICLFVIQRYIFVIWSWKLRFQIQKMKNRSKQFNSKGVHWAFHDPYDRRGLELSNSSHFAHSQSCRLFWSVTIISDGCLFCHSHHGHGHLYLSLSTALENTVQWRRYICAFSACIADFNWWLTLCTRYLCRTEIWHPTVWSVFLMTVTCCNAMLKSSNCSLKK